MQIIIAVNDETLQAVSMGPDESAVLDKVAGVITNHFGSKVQIRHKFPSSGCIHADCDQDCLPCLLEWLNEERIGKACPDEGHSLGGA